MESEKDEENIQTKNEENSFSNEEEIEAKQETIKSFVHQTSIRHPVETFDMDNVGARPSRLQKSAAVDGEWRE
ncbi:hypothetical protein G5I_04251 [Acromyrmex echinatior]|uniref:Uncharacterized protein n=1 Tax=Acromyrmex echinatior TaxID=103372 RepID=F4WF45_ACREC|nr:hypothetical protein G5I_04251 [Acromyrmex echinatior]